jgi:hypothetical protein
MIQPALLLLLSYMNIFCTQKELPLVITRIIDDRIPGVSVSDTHKEGRAIDISVHGWNIKDIDGACSYLNNLLANKIGTGPQGQSPRVAVFEDGIARGTAPHIHLQVKVCPSFLEVIDGT